MTSNLASHLIAEADPSDFTLKDRVFESLRAHFRPEFLNRIDEVIVFNSLAARAVGPHRGDFSSKACASG